jgi:hypothetical protein
LFENIQGIEKVGSYRSEKENVDEDILSLGTGASSSNTAFHCRNYISEEYNFGVKRRYT